MTLKTLVASLILAIGFSHSALAADNQALAKEYVKLPDVQLMMDNMFSPEGMAAQVAATLPPGVTVTEDQLQRIGVVMSGAMQSLRPKLEQQMIDSSADLFSAEELSALIDFYGSEHGSAIMGKMQPFMQQTMGALSADMQRVTLQVTPELAKILQETN
ncbi:DUF2059 domain-containing protein [Ruegeria arenilitoris]|uniref:DUF2059 domain-containing protein n=1 Tax=Ruegeria arenilitoris TaxID=1173585 RepID=UPI001481B51F